MNLFSSNQVTQGYVVTGVEGANNASTFSTGKNLILCTTPDNKTIYFKHKGKGGVTRSDLINICSIEYTNLTTAAKMAYKLKTVTVSLADQALENGKLIAGQDYILRINFTGYIGISPEDSTYTKFGIVHATKGMTPANFYTAMVKSLNDNFKREAVKMVTFEATANGIVITETEPDWIRGLKQQKRLQFTVTAVPINVVEGTTVSEVAWAEDKSVNPTDPTIVYGESDEAIGNGKLMADYEYFFMGERGDQYRLTGWPDYVPTEYMVDPTHTYDVISIHYSYSGPNEDVQKSGKDLVLLVDTAAAASSGLFSRIQALIEPSTSSDKG